MSVLSIAYRGMKAAALIVGVLVTCGFTFRPGGPIELHFKEFNAAMPRGNTVTICHAHGCQKQEKYSFTAADISELAELMDRVRTSDTPHEERRAISYAIAWMERRVGPSTGTANDRASLGFFNASGQLDCVDEATNATSYMIVLQNNDLLRHHDVIRPFSKASFFQWPHFAAMIKERRTGRVYAVDSGVGPNDTNPSVQLASKWYIDEGGRAPSPAPAQTFATAVHEPQVTLKSSDDLAQLVQQILREQ